MNSPLAGLWTIYKPAMFRGRILKESSELEWSLKIWQSLYKFPLLSLNLSVPPLTIVSYIGSDQNTDQGFCKELLKLWESLDMEINISLAK